MAQEYGRVPKKGGIMGGGKSFCVRRRDSGGELMGSVEEATNQRLVRGRRRVELVDIALLDLAHEIGAAEEIGSQLGSDLARNGGDLIARDLAEGNRAASGNQVRAPLVDEAGVPESKESDERSSGAEEPAGRTEAKVHALEEDGQAENEDGSEGEEEAIAERGHAVPIGIAGEDVVKGGGNESEAGRDGARAAIEQTKQEASESEDEKRSPGEEAVVAREEDIAPERSAPLPRDAAIGAEAKEAAENDAAGDQRRHNADGDEDEEEAMSAERAEEGSGGEGAEAGRVRAEGSKKRKQEEHAIGEIDIEHQTGNEAEQGPLGNGARGAGAVPIPEEESDGENRMGMGPCGIEVHVEGESGCEPNAEGSEQSPFFEDVLTSNGKGEP